MDPMPDASHRGWPLPERPWVMRQRWHDLLFAHGRVDPSALRPLVPAALELDLFDGQAYVGVVPFRMSGIALRGLPAVPGTDAFPELNVRTYVTKDGKPGVWFFSLDAANALAVWVARHWYHLPYYRAEMTCAAEGEGIRYSSRRTHGGAPAAALEARYEPVEPPRAARAGTLEHFLTERYCLYTARGDGRLLRGEILHTPWPIQLARAQISTQTMSAAAGIPPLKLELLHFARFLDVWIWGLEEV